MNVYKAIGDSGEQAATDYLINKGYKILDRNYHSRFGEIDIIALKDEYITFVEVKTRDVKSFIKPKFSVTRSKQLKIIRTAMIYLSEHELDTEVSFDIIEVFNNKGNIAAINHIKSAFIVEDEYEIF